MKEFEVKNGVASSRPVTEGTAQPGVGEPCIQLYFANAVIRALLGMTYHVNRASTLLEETEALLGMIRSAVCTLNTVVDQTVSVSQCCNLTKK